MKTRAAAANKRATHTAVAAASRTRRTRRPQQRSLEQLAARAGTLRALRERGDVHGLQAALRIDYVRQAGRATSRWVGALGCRRLRLGDLSSSSQQQR